MRGIITRYTHKSGGQGRLLLQDEPHILVARGGRVQPPGQVCLWPVFTRHTNEELFLKHVLKDCRITKKNICD